MEQASFDSHYTTGLDVNLAGGYRFDLGAVGMVRTEIEFSYINYSLDRIDVSGPRGNRTARPTSGSDINRYGGSVNVFYDLPVAGGVVPFVGVGIGAQSNEQGSGTGTTTGAFGTSSAHFFGGSSTDGIWLAEGGLDIAIADHLKLVPAYRFTETFDSTQPTHIIKLGLRYEF
jgi:opacity protein-like surface antigen